MTMSVDEARDRLREVEAQYRDVEEKHNEVIVGLPTAERVLAQVESRAELEATARELLEAKEVYAVIEKEASDRRSERAWVDLKAVEVDLIEAVEEAEADAQKLGTSLSHVLNLSKRRYAFRQEASGRAPRSLLARNTVVGWLTWRLWDLDLPGLDSPAHHHRAPLAELLGLAQEPNEQGEQK